MHWTLVVDKRFDRGSISDNELSATTSSAQSRATSALKGYTLQPEWSYLERNSNMKKKQSAQLLLLPAARARKRNGKQNGEISAMPVSLEVLSRHLRHSTGVEGVPLSDDAAFRTDLGAAIIGDCVDILRRVPNETFDLVVTSPPYDGQPKYGNGERYDRSWYSGFFLEVTAEILRTLKPHGSFVLNYRSKRHGGERGTIQYELVFWLRKQGFLFCDDFI